MIGSSKTKGIFQLEVNINIELPNVTILFVASVVQSAPDNRAEMFVVKRLRLLGYLFGSDVYMQFKNKKSGKSEIYIYEINIVSIITTRKKTI